ncbi:MAG: type II toxin-antitoxin system VapC family toxin [Candidatus Bathyarchaeia archaeon]
MVKIVVDTYGWIEIFLGSESGKRTKEIIEKGEEVYTPDIVGAEIARKYLREGVGEQEVLERLTVIEESSEIVPISKRIAFEAAKCYMELMEKARLEKLRAPSLFDAIILATARALNAKLVTGDEHFRGMDGIIWIGL